MSIVVTSNHQEPQTAVEAGEANTEESTNVPASAKEQDETSDDSEASQEEESQDEESEESEDSEETEGDEDKAEKPKRLGKYERRVKRLQGKLSEKDREIEYLRRMTQEGKPQETPQKHEEPQQTKPEDSEPDPDTFDEYKDYLKAYAKWTVTEERRAAKAEDEKAQVQTSQQKLYQDYAAKAQTFAEAHEDYQEVVEGVDHIVAQPAITAAVLKHGPELAYALALDPKEFERINALDPMDALLAIGEVKSRLSKSSPKEKPKPKLTSAPPPPNPVGSKSNGKAKKSIYDSGLSQSEYERLRMEQIKNRQSAF